VLVNKDYQCTCACIANVLGDRLVTSGSKCWGKETSCEIHLHCVTRLSFYSVTLMPTDRFLGLCALITQTIYFKR